MIHGEKENLIKKLIDKTFQKKANWHKMDQRIYGLKFETGSVAISKHTDREYVLSIFNDKGIPVEKIIAEVFNPFFDLLAKLYSEVEAFYLKPQETIDSILNEIDDKDLIG